MSKFIEIKAFGSENRRFVNTKHIEEVVEVDENMCRIYMAFSVPDADEQDYFEVDMPYDEVVAMIKKEGGADA